MVGGRAERRLHRCHSSGGMRGGVCLVAAEAHELDVLISRDRNVNMEPTGGCDGLSSSSETEGLGEVWGSREREVGRTGGERQ